MKTSRRAWLKSVGVVAAGVTAGLTMGIRPGIAWAGEPSAEEILKNADAVRNPAESYFLRVGVESSDSPGNPSEFEVSLSGNTKTIVRTVKPVKDRGRGMLMVNEDMWAYVPNLKRSVRVSLNQRLVGQTANGDISRMRWSGDYSGVIEATTDKEWTLLLTATKKGLTYDKLRVWVEKGSFHPLRAEFLTLQGKALKRATYRAYKELVGRVRPTEIEIRDAVKADEVSVIKVLEMKVQQFPASMFTPEALQ